MIFRHPPSPADPLRLALSQSYLADEHDSLTCLLDSLDVSESARLRISHYAYQLVARIREQPSQGGLTAFMQEYDLSSQEGVMLLCLAEALLRIPDAATADALIRDKLAQAHWDAHLGQSPSLFVNAGTWGLMLTGRLVRLDESVQRDPTVLLQRLLSRLSEPVLRTALKEAMRIMGHQFVMGRSIEEALARSRHKDNQDYRFSFDMLGEAALSEADAERYFQRYLQAIDAIGQHGEHTDVFDAPGISIKLSALHPRFEEAQATRVMAELVPRVRRLAEAAAQAGMGLTIDGEEADRLELTLDVFAAVYTQPSLQHWPGLGVVVQAYQKRAPAVIDWLAAQAREVKRPIMLRLVKGAYWDTEIKRAQEQGLNGFPVFTRKEHTDVAYLACAQQILRAGECFYPQFATHNAHTLASVVEYAGPSTAFELQRLHGMGEALYQQVIHDPKRPIPCRVYAPVGAHKDLLPYLVRRLLENGANTSFVNRISDARAPIAEVIADPLEKVLHSKHQPHPAIVLPEALFGAERHNSRGINLSDRESLRRLSQAMAPFAASTWDAVVPGTQASAGGRMHSVNPADSGQVVGEVLQADAGTLQQALANARTAAQSWSATAVEERARILEQAADLLQQHTPELISLIVRESGRCVPDALSEVREAVDFCRYYAVQARQLFGAVNVLPGPVGERNELSWHGRGVFVCISPWNFPLSIFCGQVVAALVAGNCVLAKPASQTPCIAQRVVQLLHEAGVPEAVLQLVPASGALIEQTLLSDARIAGVTFTGSTHTASTINQALARRPGPIVPLIAETGGQNAMIVDSSALPEQVVSDVLTSAFNSAGQRCSALRVLFLQDDVAERIIDLLRGAMAQLTVGDPQYLDTDVGPLIDEAALRKMQQHAERMQEEGKLIYRVPVSAGSAKGHFFGPCAFEIDALSQLPEEVFGPILHVIRYAGDELDAVIDAINATQYGLTLGIHTRIEARAQYIRQRVRVGNIYFNRNITGAVVGTQPFGGEGLSGTGPKAGGPHYLQRFATEQVFSNNTAAIGGNASLLSLRDNE
jgi:RHH-type proline utilization regulon transcriptional repressor/proline dehydrogenase/delta 1-pyrroline-5-carboxylate dehydrogenase